MASSKRNFIAGRMNKSVDERLVPNSEYVDAMNVRLGSTEDSDIGSVENSKGNSLLTDVILGVYVSISYPLSSNAVCLGAFEDGANETIYWFIHDKNATDTATGRADLIVSFNARTNSTTPHVISFKNANDSTNTTLNFNERYLINNIDKVGDLLFFTDNYNPPRRINVNKDYPYPLTITGDDRFSYNELLVVVKPPTQAPTVQAVKSGSSESFMEDKFLCYGYRYKYEDNEYSATSQFTNPVFIPSSFFLINGLNEGMVNSINSALISFNTGDSLVKGVDILFKEAKSNVIKVVETLDKSKLNYIDNTTQTYSFSNKKIFTILASAEVLRLYDNVPLLSNAQTLMGNRLMYGNYYEGYDVDSNIDYYTDIESIINLNTEISSTVSGYPYTVSGSLIGSTSVIRPDFSPVKDDLTVGAVITISFNITHGQFDGYSGTDPTQTTQEINTSFTYTLPQSFDSVSELINSTDFQDRISSNSLLDGWCAGTSLTDIFNCRIPNSLGSAGGTDVWNKFNSGVMSAGQGFQVEMYGDNEFLIKVPAIGFTDNILNPDAGNTEWEFFDVSNVFINFINAGTPASLHSNRGYETGMVYMDEFNRSTSVLTSGRNSNSIPCSASDTSNKIKVTIPTSQRAPSWAKRYKFVIKPDSENYETIYSTGYYTDPSDNHTYFLLEGQNISKIEEGDILFVKRDSFGALDSCSTTTVLEKKTQLEGFIKPLDNDGNILIVPAGIYMKVFANNFTAVTSEDSFVFPGKKEIRVESGELTNPTAEVYGRAYMYYGDFQKSIDVTSPTVKTYNNYDIPVGSKITIDLDLYRNKGRVTNGCKYRSYKLKREFISSNNYTDIIEWWNNDNIGNIIDSGSKNITEISNTYVPELATTASDVDNFRQLAISSSDSQTTKYYYQWYRGSEADNLNKIQFLISGTSACSGSDVLGGSANIHAEFRIIRSDNLVVFETEPSDALPDVWYEGQDSYPVSTDGSGFHLDSGSSANILDQNQTASVPAILYLNFFDCFTFGNGVESYKVKDSITSEGFNLGNRAMSVSEQEYKRTHRASDITYSGLYNQESNVNRLNEFNLGLSNFKPLEASFGNINKIDGRKTDVLVLQEDKISYVLSSKNLLSDASGSNILTAVPEVLGQQIARTESFGISDNPESFASYGSSKFFTDSKRGALLQLKGSSASNEQLIVISDLGMGGWFRDLFTDSFKTQKLGGYDPYMKEYVLSSNDTSLPSEDVCSPCGTSRTVDFSADAEESTQTFCVKLPKTTGTATVDYEIPVGSTIYMSIVYQGVTTNHPNLAGSGTVSYQKPTTSPNYATILISNTVGSSPLTITPQCPTGEATILKTIVLTNNDDIGKFLHIGHNFEDVNSDNSSPDAQIEFIKNEVGDSVFASVFTEQVGFKGDSVFPSQDSYVNMRSNKWLPVDNYDVDEQDNFKWFVSYIDYGNNSTDLTSLLGSATTLSKSGSNPTFTSSSFLYEPSTPEIYLYLIYDFRTSTPQTLCVQEGVESYTNLDAVCCECECNAASTEYSITNTSVTTVVITTSAGNYMLTGGKSLTELCSTTYPTMSPVTKGVLINVTGCDC